MVIPASLQTTAKVVASLFAWDAEEADAHMGVKECALVEHGPLVPVLVVSMPSKPVDPPSRKRGCAGGMIKVRSSPTFHDGRKGQCCEKCRYNNQEYTRYHGTSAFATLMTDSFKLKPSGKASREKGPGPGFFHYGKEQWRKAFQYSGPQSLHCEGLQRTPLLRVVCVVQMMCWTSCKNCDWGKTSYGCDRYSVTSLLFVQHVSCAGLPKLYDHEEVQDSTFPISSNPLRSDLLPVQPG